MDTFPEDLLPQRDKRIELLTAKWEQVRLEAYDLHVRAMAAEAAADACPDAAYAKMLREGAQNLLGARQLEHLCRAKIAEARSYKITLNTLEKPSDS